MTDRLPWPSANEATLLIRNDLAKADDPTRALGQATRWISLYIDSLPRAREAGDAAFAHVLAAPEVRTDIRMEALLAGATRYKLRTMGIESTAMPEWTVKSPLPEIWFARPGALPRLATHSINTSPPELRRLGIMLPEIAVQDTDHPTRNNGSNSDRNSSRGNTDHSPEL